ncbi:MULTISPECIES: hypothetical protein [Streptomyces]|uniref:hypothetical protein n=1 Tax=Streptomyces TaxID=1883 RepID=UPI0015E36E51|nr:MULTISPECIES: hypothetical protein [Streptomyces]
MTEPVDPWDYSTPSQAEGEREADGAGGGPEVVRSTPSQAEGERIAETAEEEAVEET